MNMTLLMTTQIFVSQQLLQPLMRQAHLALFWADLATVNKLLQTKSRELEQRLPGVLKLQSLPRNTTMQMLLESVAECIQLMNVRRLLMLSLKHHLLMMSVMFDVLIKLLLTKIHQICNLVIFIDPLAFKARHWS